MRRIVQLFIAVVLLIPIESKAQKWMSNLEMGKENPSFFEVRDAFHKQFEGLDIEDYAKDYKKFKRWEFQMESRIDQAGFFPAKTFWEECQKVNERRRDTPSRNATWTQLGPLSTPLWTANNVLNNERSGTGRVECIEFHPMDENTIWVGAHSGGLWKTTDGGESWITTSDELPSIGISDIVVHPENPDILFIGTGDRDTDWTYSIGLLKSIDGGATFENTGLNHEMQEQEVITEILINPDNPEIMVVSSTKGIYKSSDAADTWEQVASGTFKDMSYMPGNSNVIYATTYDYFGGAKIYRSQDGGSNFELLDTGIASSGISRITLGVTVANSEVVYAVCARDYPVHNLYGVYKSIDGGDTWTETVSGDDINLLGRSLTGDDEEGYGWYTLSIEVSPLDEDELYVGGVNLWKSIDGGVSWELRTTEIQNVSGLTTMWVDHHEIRFSPYTYDLFTANDGGIYKSQDQAETFIDITDGLGINQIYRIGCAASDQDVVVAGCQDQFGMLYNNGDWKALYTGEASEHFIAHDDPETLYCYGFMFGMIRSYNGGYYYTNINPPGVDNNHWLAPTMMHPTDPNTIYLGVNGLYKSTNKGSSWETLHPNLSGSQELESMDVAPSDDNYIYAASFNGIWRTIDGGESWQSIKSGLPYGTFIKDIAVSATDPNHLWICSGKFNDGVKVFESFNAGETWGNISGNLPNVPVHSIVHYHGSYNSLFVGTDVGVYYYNKLINEWEDYSNGLPNVVCLELEIHYGSGKLRAGTHGRGLWECDLPMDVSVKEHHQNVDFLLMPNPAKDRCVVRITGSNPGEKSLLIKDINGRIVRSVELEKNQTSCEYTFELLDLHNGVYIVELWLNNDYVSSKKLIKF